MGRPRILLVVLGAAALGTAIVMAGCSLSLDGFSGGEAEANDAAADASGPTSGDSSGPGGGDATGAGDSAVDASLCDNQPSSVVFCDDFDRTSLLGKWKSKNVNAGGQVDLVAGTAGRGGSEVRAAIPESSSGGKPEADLSLAPNNQANIIDYRYRFRVTGPIPAGKDGAQAMNIYVSHADKSYTAVYLDITSSGLTVAEQFFAASGTSTFLQHKATDPLVYDVWHDAEMKVTTMAPPHISLWIDGTLVVDVESDATLVRGSVQIAGGIHYSAPPAGPLDLHFDDVVLDIR